MAQNYITLSRSKLYDLVWSKPVTDVAKELGISDVALAKRCRAINIPLPPRGYWARVAAGQRPRRPPLPPFGSERTGKGRKAASPGSRPSYVTTTRSNDADGTTTSEPALTFDPDRNAHALRIDDHAVPALTTTITATIHDCGDLVKRTARYYKHPLRSELKFTRGEATGPIVRLEVSPDTLNRALLFADTFLKAATELAWTAIPPPEPVRPDPRHYYGRAPEPTRNPGSEFVDLQVDGKRIEFSLNERFELRELPPTQTELNKQRRMPYYRPERRTEKVWSGVLRLKRERPSYSYHVDAKSWRESANQTLEAQLPKILADFRAVAARMKEVDDEEERLERARVEAARLQQELSARRAANEKLIRELERQVGAWHRTQLLRRYLRAAKRAVGADGYFVKVDERKVDFLSWAEHYINQMDPLHPDPRHPDFQHERSNYYGAEEKRPQEEFQRLTGHTWERASKLVADETEGGDEPDTADDEYDDAFDDDD